MTEPNPNAANTPSSATQVPATPVAARRDKFASMAAAHRQKQTPSPAVASSNSPSTTTVPATTASAAPVSVPAAPVVVAAAPIPAPTNPVSAPASMQQTATSSSVPPVAAPPAAVPAPPRRGKFALFASSSGGKGVKGSSATPSISSQASQQQSELEKKREYLKVRMSQRDSVLKDLERAENLTWKLLTLAASTTRALSTLGGVDKETKTSSLTTPTPGETAESSTTTNISETSKEYRETIHQIHSLLAPRASLVVPYQNHQTDFQRQQQQKEEITKTETETTKKSNKAAYAQKDDCNNNMYAARVEMRLALEKQKVLSELLRLEQRDNDQSRENLPTGEVQETNTTSPDIGNNSSRKRARED